MPQFHLRIPAEDFLEADIEVLQKNHARLSPYLNWAKNSPTLESQLAFVTRANEMEKLGKEFHRMIYINDILSGGVSLHSLKTREDGLVIAQIGYWVSLENEGKGIVQNAIQEILELAAEVNIDILEIQTHLSNERSQKTAIKAGFKEIWKNTEKIGYQFTL